MKISIRQRLDCFVVWQHGFPNIFNILDNIEKSDFKILEIKKINTSDISKFLKLVYSHDYAPYIHLKSKLKYLKQAKNKYVYLIVVLNNNKEEFFKGEGSFKHIESHSMNSLKWDIRNEFNEKDSFGEISHNHVIHGTDSESQAVFLINKFKFNIQKFNSFSSIFPSHINQTSSFNVQRVSLDFLKSRIINNKSSSLLHVSKTPHFMFLSKSSLTYEYYLAANLGLGIKRYHSPYKFRTLFNKVSKSNFHNSDPIIISNDGTILDGNHRAAIFCYLGEKEVNAIVI